MILRLIYRRSANLVAKKKGLDRSEFVVKNKFPFIFEGLQHQVTIIQE